ncbi:MAG: hypothetical protein NPIRA04_29870 [Nitrospirales bacterium]|nr:MAG: hypothetical protein NPIRA04_29870 [Nitrospirales bacterium]
MRVNAGRTGLTLTGVIVQRQSASVTVILQGQGPIHYQPVAIHGSQLAIDLSHSISSLKFDKLQVGHRLLKDIRIEQYTQKLRLVFALVARVRYAIKVSGNVLAIQFK